MLNNVKAKKDAIVDDMVRFNLPDSSLQQARAQGEKRYIIKKGQLCPLNIKNEHINNTFRAGERRAIYNPKPLKRE